MSSEPIEPRAFQERMRTSGPPDDPSLASAVERLFSRYDFFTNGTADHPAKYPEGDVPRWMIVGSVDHEKIRAFEYLVREGVLVKTTDGSDGNHAHYRLIDETTLSSIVAAHDAPIPAEVVERAVRGVLANYSSGLGPYGVPESVLVDSVPHASLALDRLVAAGVFVLAPWSTDTGPDEHHYTLDRSLTD